MGCLRVPALVDVTQSRKKLRVPEIRVWCHPHNGKDDDFYQIFNSFKQAIVFIRENKRLHPELPLIAFEGYEFNLFEFVKPKVKTK